MYTKFIVSLAAIVLSCAAFADEPKPAAAPGRVVKMLMTQKLPELSGSRVTQMLTVEYAPGAELPSHTHPGPVYGYVLEGSFATEVDGQPLTTYTKGQTFFEPEGGVHRVAKNPSATEPLKLLIFVLAEEGKPLVAPTK